MIDQKFLESLGVTDESAVQKITETYTADIQAEQDAAATAKTQLDEANKTIQSYKIWTLTASSSLQPNGKKSMSRQRQTAKRRITATAWISLFSNRA